MKLKFTRSAREQFLAAVSYIKSDNPTAAASFFDRAETSLRELEGFPAAGRSIPEFPSLPHRELIVNPYRFFYRVVDDTIWVVGVWHGRQLPEEPH
jgi:toxin ParE1/3/4